MKTNINNILKATGILIAGVLLGWLIFGGEKNNEEAMHDHSISNSAEIWTCSMHPQVRSNEPGECPICGMDLIPLAVEDSEANPAVYQMSESAMKLANVQTIRVGSTEAGQKVRLNGKIQIDERNTYTQSSHFPGRIEQLMVNFTGESIKKGQTLAKIYSPELVAAQEELLQAASIKESQPQLFEAAKRKFNNWRIGENQINEIISSGKVKQVFPLKADISGIVTNKMVELGDYVESGVPIYEISDLSKLWVLFDVYESELGWIKEGSEVTYTVKSLPGRSFNGIISFIDPLINSQSRVATARVEISNKEGLLKPQMFVSGVIENPVEQGNDEIIIPQSAVLWTGKRSVVYMQESGGFKMREVTLGTALGENYVVQEGLQRGEEIVINGAFTIDAAAELAGKPSMMSHENEQVDQHHLQEISIQEKKALLPLFEAYFEMKNALASDNNAGAKMGARNMSKAFTNLNNNDFSSNSKMVRRQISRVLEQTMEGLNDKQIEDVRKNFIAISEAMIALAKAFDPLDAPLYVQHCPMADNNVGADWLSREEEIINPYFGESMLSCGEVKWVIR
ncbi:efflux RND transporter periplasmic adaptor subunit [Marivirga lumbricoides]|uniref:Efflux RND transporter periplasmic adaptor subunit n=1 Tax=Marivirga lumbricoides TaxID=1046115 RepID=A0A2T4DSE0_9BACT|nr:efflux RND transporter periplasmic adaptor subunit [Marivirga lumbricoides]